MLYIHTFVLCFHTCRAMSIFRFLSQFITQLAHFALSYIGTKLKDMGYIISNYQLLNLINYFHIT